MLVKNTNENAFSDISERYRPLIESMVAAYRGDMKKSGIDEDDLRQEALAALYSALISYKEDGDVTFGLYAKVCIRNRMISLLRKNRPESALDEVAEDEYGDPAFQHGVNPEEQYIDKESYNGLIREIEQTLTDYECRVFRLYLGDKSYKQIGDILGKSEKSVDNALFRIKTKLKKLITDSSKE